MLGSLGELRKSPTQLLLDMAAYGDLSYTRFAAARMYFVNSPELIEEVLMGRHRECVKDWGTRELIPLVGHGLLTNEGDDWRKQRKLAAPPLQPKRIAGYAKTMVECTQRLCDDLRDDEVRDIHHDMTGVTLEIVGRTLLGFDPRRDAERIAHVLDVAMVHMDKQLRTAIGMLPMSVPTLGRLRFRKAVSELDTIIYRIIARCRAHGEGEDHLLARLTHMRDEDGRGMSDKQLRDEAVTMLLAGHETTALLLSYAVHSLSEHPAVAQRLQAELDAQLGARALGIEDLPKLPFLEAVVRETLRLYPPAFAIAREVTSPFTLGEYAIGKGDQLMLSAFVMQRNARYFPDPEAFKPERWLDPQISQLPRFAYFPFGGGPRVCIGNHFAMMEAQLVLGTLLQHAELTVSPGYKLRLDPVITLRPERGIPVLVRRRKPQRATARIANV